MQGKGKSLIHMVEFSFKTIQNHDRGTSLHDLYQGEKPFHVELVSSAGQKLKARFEGFHYNRSLSTILIGTYIDETNPEEIVTKKLAFMKVTNARLRFDPIEDE